MSNNENSITIDNGQILIVERKKPAKVAFYLAVFIFGMQAFFFLLRYEESENLYELVVAGVLSFLLGLAVSREIFFRTNRNEIRVHEVQGVKITKPLFGYGNVFLKLRLGNKTREVFIDEHRAKEIKKELDPFWKKCFWNVFFDTFSSSWITILTTAILSVPQVDKYFFGIRRRFLLLRFW